MKNSLSVPGIKIFLVAFCEQKSGHVYITPKSFTISASFCHQK